MKDKGGLAPELTNDEAGHDLQLNRTGKRCTTSGGLGKGGADHQEQTAVRLSFKS